MVEFSRRFFNVSSDSNPNIICVFYLYWQHSRIGKGAKFARTVNLCHYPSTPGRNPKLKLAKIPVSTEISEKEIAKLEKLPMDLFSCCL